MIEPVLKDKAFLMDHLATEGVDDSLHIWWLGQSGYFIKQNSASVLIDPYLSDSLTKKYAQTNNPHIRMTANVVAPGSGLPGPSFICVTHQHTDHMDPETLRPIVERFPWVVLVVPKAWQELAMERSGAPASRVHVIDAGENVTMVGYEIIAVPAAHDRIEKDNAGHCKYLGYVIRNGEFTLYHSGDTIVYDGMVELLRPFNIDVAMLPINGKVGNMNGADAAGLAKAIGAKLVVPCHYEMFEFNTADPREQFIPECQRLGQPYRVLRAGERLTLHSTKLGG